MEGKTYTEVMIPMGDNKRQLDRAGSTSYVRTSFGNVGSPGDRRPRWRASGRPTLSRKTPWTEAPARSQRSRAIVDSEDLEALGEPGNTKQWLPDAATLRGWTSERPPGPGHVGAGRAVEQPSDGGPSCSLIHRPSRGSVAAVARRHEARRAPGRAAGPPAPARHHRP